MQKMAGILVVVMLLCPIFSFGQKVEEGTIKIGKSEASGFIATSKYDKGQIEEALAAEFTKAGLKKPGKKKKFITYKEVEWPAISPAKIDVYYKVGTKKRRTKVYFIVSKGYNNYVTSANDAIIATNITTFLGQIDATAALNEEIKRKEQEVNEMNAKLEKEKAALQKAEDEKRKKEQEIEDMKKGK
jgi:hypothetical protein